MSRNEVNVRDKNPWYLPTRTGEVSRYLQVWCGDAYLLVRKSDGLTEVGYKDEGEDSLPVATDARCADWLRIFQWRVEQTFPWAAGGNHP